MHLVMHADERRRGYIMMMINITVLLLPSTKKDIDDLHESFGSWNTVDFKWGIMGKDFYLFSKKEVAHFSILVCHQCQYDLSGT